MPKARSSNTIATRSSSGSGSRISGGSGGAGGGSGAGIGGPLEETEMATRLEERLNEARTIPVNMESRTRRRNEELLVTFDPNTPGVARVQSPSGNEYTVNYDDDTCNCMHYRIRGAECRHIQATNIARGELQGTLDMPDAAVGQANIDINEALQNQQNMDQIAEENRRALTGEYEDDGYFYSDHQEEFEAALERVRNEPLPYDRANALNGSNITFGVELEFVDGDSDAIARELYSLGIVSEPRMQSYHSRSVRGKWKLERDGTVTSGRRGGELVSPVLQDTPETWEQIEKICEVAKRHGARINTKCGGHVHVGMDPLDEARQRWRRFFKSIKGHEETIYRLSGGTEGRIRSGHRYFAMPFANRAEYGTTRRVTMNSVNDVHALTADVGNRDRYYGINLTNVHSYGRPNTVEFRYFNGSLDPATIQANVKVAAGVMMASEKARTKDLDTEATPETMKRRGNMINNATNGRNNEAMMQFVDTFFTRKKDKDHILGVLARNNWR